MSDYNNIKVEQVQMSSTNQADSDAQFDDESSNNQSGGVVGTDNAGENQSQCVELHHDDPSPFVDEVESHHDTNYNDRSGKRHRDSDDKQDGSLSSAAPKRARNNMRGDDKIELRMLIPVNTAGALIGKGGSNIRELRQEFNANIQIPDSNGYERVVTAVTPSIEDLSKFVGKAGRCLNERMRPREECSVRLLIHKSQAGTIIGVKGTRIKELRETTGAKIKVNQECCPGSTDRVCQITGPNDILIKCVVHVLELLQTAPPKGHVQNYDPSFFDDSYNYGGFNGFDPECPFEHALRRRNREPGFDSMPPFRNNRGGGGGNGGGGGRARYEDDFEDYGRRRMGGGGGGGSIGGGSMGGGGSRMRYPPDRPMRRGPSRMGGPGPMRRPSRLAYNFEDEGGFGDYDDGAAGFDNRGGEGPLGNFKDTHGGDGKRESTQVTIPTALAGSIIGVRGQRIRQIRQDSGANIKIEEELQGTKERIITIIGNPEQIQNAQYLLQKSVKLYSGERF